jgi:hypothetical protein
VSSSHDPDGNLVEIVAKVSRHVSQEGDED